MWPPAAPVRFRHGEAATGRVPEQAMVMRTPGFSQFQNPDVPNRVALALVPLPNAPDVIGNMLRLPVDTGPIGQRDHKRVVLAILHRPGVHASRRDDVFFQAAQTHSMLVNLDGVFIDWPCFRWDAATPLMRLRNSGFAARPLANRGGFFYGRSSCFYMDKPAPFGRLRRFAADRVSPTISNILAELIARQEIERGKRGNVGHRCGSVAS